MDKTIFPTCSKPIFETFETPPAMHSVPDVLASVTALFHAGKITGLCAVVEKVSRFQTTSG
jgi:hypothetical protein